VLTGTIPATCANGTKVVISGMTGNTAANGNFWLGNVTAGAGGTATVYSDAGLTTPVTGNGAWVSGGTVTANAKVWAPKFFVEPSDGSIHFLVNLIPSAGTSFQVYMIDLASPNDPTSTPTAPYAITGTGLPSSMYDAMMIKIGSTYYLLYGAGGVGCFTSASRATGFTQQFTVASNHFGVGAVEGPYLLVLDDGNVLLYADYVPVDSTKGCFALKLASGTFPASDTWSTSRNAQTLIGSTGNWEVCLPRHGSIIRASWP
jgi:hypothetical protein